MQTRLLALLAFLLLAVLPSITSLKAVTAAPCTLDWDLSPDPTVTGYLLCYCIAGSDVTNSLDVGMTNEVTLFDLTATSNYVFYVVAYDATGLQSPPSNLVDYCPPVLSLLTVAPAAAGTVNLQFSAAPGTPCHIEYTPTLDPAQWQTLGSGTADTNGNVILTDTLSGTSPSRLYRAVTP